MMITLIRVTPLPVTILDSSALMERHMGGKLTQVIYTPTASAVLCADEAALRPDCSVSLQSSKRSLF